MKIRTSDVVLWLSLPGREGITKKQNSIIKPYRTHISKFDGQPITTLAIMLDRSVFLKRRQDELLTVFEGLKPYKLLAELAIYHPSDKSSFSVDIPLRLAGCLLALGAKLRIISYLTEP